MKNLNLEELNSLAIKEGFSNAHNAITCAVTYRNAYSVHFEKEKSLRVILNAVKELSSKEMNSVIDEKLKELDSE